MVENIKCIEKYKETDAILRSGWLSDPNTRNSPYVGPVIPDNQGTSWIINSPDGKCTGYSLKKKRIETLQFAGRITPELIKPQLATIPESCGDFCIL